MIKNTKKRGSINLSLILGSGLLFFLIVAAGFFFLDTKTENKKSLIEKQEKLLCDKRQKERKDLTEHAKGEFKSIVFPNAGYSFSQLSFNDKDASQKKLLEKAEKTILLNLWATWCATCREEMPSLNALQKRKEKEKFEVIAINIDTGDPEKPKEFLASINIDTLPYYYENTLTLFENLKKKGLIIGLPVSFLIDTKGCLLATLSGPADWSSKDAVNLIDHAILVSEK